MRIKMLRAEQAELVKKGAAILEAARRENRRLTEDERKQGNAILVDLRAVEADLDVEEGVLEGERRLSSDDPQIERGARSRGGVPAEARPYGSFGEQIAAVIESTRAHRVDERQTQIHKYGASGMSEGVLADGGALVQVDFAEELLQSTYETGILVAKTRRQPCGPRSNGLKINAVNETSRANGSRWGGVLAYWLAEAGTKTPSAPKFRQIELDLKKLIGLCYLTDELLQDTVALDAFVREAFAAEFGFRLDDAIIRGTGAGMPLGILNSPAKVAVAKEPGQGAATILAENLEKAYARMPAASLSRAEWYFNVECWPQFFKLSHAIGTGGVPVFVPAGGISGAPFGTIFGRPLVPIEQAEALGTEGDVIFADLKQYVFLEKGGMQAASSIHVKFLTDETALRFVVRVDGQPIPASPVTPYKGSATLSPIVTIATRA